MVKKKICSCFYVADLLTFRLENVEERNGLYMFLLDTLVEALRYCSVVLKMHLIFNFLCFKKVKLEGFSL